VDDTGCVGDIGERLAGSGELIGENCRRHGMFPAAAQCGCPQSPLRICSRRQCYGDLPRLIESQKGEGALHIFDRMRQSEFDGVDALQEPGAQRRIASDQVGDVTDVDRFVGQQNQQPRRYGRERRNFAQTGQDGRFGQFRESSAYRPLQRSLEGLFTAGPAPSGVHYKMLRRSWVARRRAALSRKRRS
jgi:hypothetical protein